jgi:hypothetical protein
MKNNEDHGCRGSSNRYGNHWSERSDSISG